MHDYRRSNVTVENASAITAVCALGQRLDCDSPAFRARLGSSARIDKLDLTASIRSFVGDQRDELSPRGVVHILGEHSSRKAFDIEVFERDASETVDELTAFFMQEVAAGVAGVGLKLGHGGTALATHLRSALGTGEGALQTTELGGVALCDALALDECAVAQGGEAGQSEVDADALSAGAVNGGNIEVQNEIPLASISREDCGLGFARPCAVPASLDLTGHADESKLPGLSQAQAVTEHEVCGVVAVAGFETRKAGSIAALAAGEERLERLVELSHHLLFSGAGPASDMRKVATDSRQARDLLVSADRNTLAISENAVLKTGVVKLAKVREHFGQERGLRPVRLDAEFVAQHGHRSDAFLVLDVLADGCFGNVPNGAREVRARPQRWKTRTQVRKLLTQEPRRRPLKAVDDLGRRARRVRFYKQVNVIWHHLRLVHQEAMFSGNLRKQLFQAHINRWHENGAAVLRAPHKVILQRVHRTRISGIAFAFHAELDMRRKTNCQHLDERKGGASSAG